LGRIARAAGRGNLGEGQLLAPRRRPQASSSDDPVSSSQPLAGSGIGVTGVPASQS
jgi:hypothetical protein